VTWSLDQTDPYAYTLLDVNGNAIAELNFYNTGEQLETDTHFIVNLAAAAPDLLATLQHYLEPTATQRHHARSAPYALLKLLNAYPERTGWGTT
jgi:hypothetical protein